MKGERYLPSGRRGMGRAKISPIHGDQRGARRLPIVAMQRPCVASDETAIRFAGAPRLNAEARATGRWDKTGARSGLPFQDVLYYSTHLA
jgi:hypothetical protein